MSWTYTVIDRNEENTAVYKSTHKDLAIHEYLSIILNELNILKKYRLQNVKNLKSKFNNLYIVEKDERLSHYGKQYPVITAKIHLNMNDWKLYLKREDDREKELELVNSNITFVIRVLLHKIKKNITTLIGHVSKSRLLSQSNLNKIPLVFEANNYIKSKKSEETNLFDNLETEQKDEKLVEIIEDVDDDLADEIAELKKKRKIMEEKLHNIEAIHKEDVDKYSDACNDLNDEKGLLFVKKKREEELIRIFKSDRGTYIKIKNDFDEGRLEKIPLIFVDKYPVFEQMDNEDRVYDDDSYEYYKKLYKSINANVGILNNKSMGAQGRNNDNIFDSSSHSDLKNKYNNISQKTSSDFPDDDFNIPDDDTTDDHS